MKHVIKIPLTLRVEYNSTPEDYKYLQISAVQIVGSTETSIPETFIDLINDMIYEKDLADYLKDFIYERHFK